MPSWPVTLPQTPLVEGFSRSRQDARLRTSMDAGPDKVRRRYTAVPENLTCVFVMTDSQLDIFDVFYVDTLLGGALTFTWTHPMTGVSVTCRVKDEPQTVPRKRRWAVSMVIEVLP